MLNIASFADLNFSCKAGASWPGIGNRSYMKEKTLIIIGAGAAGLMAAKELSGKFGIVILEASPRIGGRINRVNRQEEIIEEGAEFIHGRLPLTFKLLKEAKINTVPVKGEFYRKKNGRLVKRDDFLQGWNKLLKKMKSVKEDMTLRQFLEIQYPGMENEVSGSPFIPMQKALTSPIPQKFQ